MRRLALSIAVLAVLAWLLPKSVLAAHWGSAYGDPPGFCPAQSFLPATYTTVVTNDPLVGTNPEQSTFWGIHANPGYDDWYGFWYGSFRGTPGDSSGWQKIAHVWYGDVGHWNFADWGWAVHGHAKQYIAYYNWTFAGQCGMGGGVWWPPPYMADVYGYPVADIYVDSVPPWPPQPRVSAVTPSSVSFTWGPVADRGDGAGPDYFESGFDHFTSWLTAGSGAPQQLASTAAPRTLTMAGLVARQQVCVHVTASDRLANTTPEQVLCAAPLAPPPAPPAPPPATVAVSPAPVGLTGLDAWLWLTPEPAPAVTRSTDGAVTYTITAAPSSVAWSFGDGSSAVVPAPGGLGLAYPARSPVAHVYDAESATGYSISASVAYSLSWTALAAGATFGPYPLGTQTVAQRGLVYPVRQAQVEVSAWR